LAHHRGVIDPEAIFHSDYAEVCVMPRNRPDGLWLTGCLPDSSA
jgi:hypothetical protein